METPDTAPLAKPSRAIDRLRPLASLVDGFTRRSGHAVASGDPSLATALLAVDGERDQCALALRAAWTDVLGSMGAPSRDHAAALLLLVTLDKVADLATTLCGEVLDPAHELRIGDAPSLRRLAELVPDMLRDALAAVLGNDRVSADEVLGRGITLDTCFAQAQTDVLQVARSGPGDMGHARQLHAMGRALERIGDSATELAGGVAG